MKMKKILMMLVLVLIFLAPAIVFAEPWPSERHRPPHKPWPSERHQPHHYHHYHNYYDGWWDHRRSWPSETRRQHYYWGGGSVFFPTPPIYHPYPWGYSYPWGYRGYYYQPQGSYYFWGRW